MGLYLYISYMVKHQTTNQDKPMNFKKIAPFSILLSLSISSNAIAGTQVTNSRSVRTTRGTVESNSSLIRNSQGMQNNSSQSLKMETYGGDINISDVAFDGRNFTGSAHSSNQRVVDPVAIGAYSNQLETINFSERFNQNLLEKATFVQKDNSHTVSADSF